MQQNIKQRSNINEREKNGYVHSWIYIDGGSFDSVWKYKAKQTGLSLMQDFSHYAKKCIEMRVIMKDDKKIDESLLGNEKIEEAIKLLQGECTQEMLAHTLTVIRKQMRKGGQFIIAVEPYISSEKINIGVVQSPDGLKWWSAFTSFDEELKCGNEVKSTFLTDIEQLFKSALEVSEISGIILNPWNRTIMLDKKLISIILGNENS